VALSLPGILEMSLTGTAEPITHQAHSTLRVCVVDDDASMSELLQSSVEKMGYPALVTTSPQEALSYIHAGKCQVVVSDVTMPEMDGLAFLDEALRLDPAIPVILITGSYSMDGAIEAIRRGAYDYLCKPLDQARLRKTLDELAELHLQRRRIRELETRLLEDLDFHGIVGKSPMMLEVFDLVRKVAKHYSNILLTGPTGSGKELVAKAIHKISPVADHRFVVCNCSALVDTLLESQLFGHVRGAFTGAMDTRPGLFEYANGGTVFLDEIGEISPPLQSKLLRVIQNREIQRVGSPEVRHVDVRLIAATNRDLRGEVMAGRFREDLYYRLNSIEIRVPGLTSRLEDIPVLIHYFLKKYNEAYNKRILGLSRRAQGVLLQHRWPGNVRELENVISSACMMATGEFIDVMDLPENLQKPGATRESGEAWLPLPLEEIRRQHIERVLEMCHGNRVRASQLLGIGRTSLYRFLKRTHPPNLHAAT
jgi:DNA-binding NtrC family response regulator